MKKLIQASCLLAALLAAGGASSSVDDAKPQTSVISASSVTQLREQAIAAGRQKNWQATASFWKQLLQLEPDDAEALFMLADAQLRVAEQAQANTPNQKQAYEAAIDSYRKALPFLSGEKLAQTHSRMAYALLYLGWRGERPDRLEQSVQESRAALTWYTREQRPLEWAAVQSDLGAALQVLGVRGNGVKLLDEAAAAYREALKEYTRQQTPLEWARVQNNLGQALKTLGERDSSPAGLQRLREARVAFEQALEVDRSAKAISKVEETQKNIQRVDALIQQRGGDLLVGKVSTAAARLQQPQKTLNEWTRKRTPQEWEAAQNNLNQALDLLAQKQRTNPHLEQVIADYKEGLQEYPRERMPGQWADMQKTLGGVFELFGQRDQGPAGVQWLRYAREALQLALEGYQRAGQSRDVEEAQKDIQSIEALIQQREDSLRLGKTSAEAPQQEPVQKTLEALKERTPQEWELAQNNLNHALRTLIEAQKGKNLVLRPLEEFTSAYHETLRQHPREQAPLEWARMQKTLGGVFETFGKQDSSPTGLQWLRYAREAFQLALEGYQGAKASRSVEWALGDLERVDALIQQRGGKAAQ